jgi:hypothetical protein
MICGAIVAGATAFAFTNSANASFHLWEVDEVYSNADGSVQFIEFFNVSNFENFMTNSGGLASNANSYTFTTNLSSTSTANTHFLMGTAGYAAISGVPAPDYTLPNQFFSVSGDTITLVNSVNGTLTFTGAQLPTDGIQSLNRIYGGSTNSGFTSAVNSPTNFAGVTGFVPEPTSLVLLGAGGVLMLGKRRRTHRFQG